MVPHFNMIYHTHFSTVYFGNFLFTMVFLLLKPVFTYLNMNISNPCLGVMVLFLCPTAQETLDCIA